MSSGDVMVAGEMTAFAVFARHRNFTRAAEELRVAQPSLHTKINKLGRALGMTLYERVGRELHLTAAGEALAALAADHRRAADDFLDRFADGRRTVHLAAGRASIQWVLSEALHALAASSAQVRVTPANAAEAIRLVESGEADVAAIAYNPPPRHLRSRHLIDVPQVLVVSPTHRLASQSSVTLDDLDGEDLVVPPTGRPHRQTIDRAFAAAGATYAVASEADGWDLLMHLASLGIGGTIVNGCVPVPTPLAAIEIVDLDPVGYWLAWREQRQLAVEPLIQALTTSG